MTKHRQMAFLRRRFLIIVGLVCLITADYIAKPAADLIHSRIPSGCWFFSILGQLAILSNLRYDGIGNKIPVIGPLVGGGHIRKGGKQIEYSMINCFEVSDFLDRIFSKEAKIIFYSFPVTIQGILNGFPDDRVCIRICFSLP